MGEFMTTIYDIAKKSGYSITTVSKVLNHHPNVSEKAKEKVLAAVEELNYMPNSTARTLATKKSWMIGVVFNEHLDIGIAHPFFGQVIEGAKKHLEFYNYDLLLVSRNLDTKRSYSDHLLRRGVDGVIVINLSPDDKEVKKIHEASIPAVYIDMALEKANIVQSDNVQGSMLAVDYLYELGHRKIAHIAGNSSTFVARERILGYQQAMGKYSLPIPDGYIVDGGYYASEGGRKAMVQLLAHTERPTAVFVSGDYMAIGAMEAVKDARLRIPEDISIVGFDDISVAKYTAPPLTTVRQEKELIGRQAAMLLLDEINGLLKGPLARKIPVRLVKRGSCIQMSGISNT